MIILFGFFVWSHINLRGLFNAKAIFVVAQLEFKFTFYNVTV